MFLLWRGFAAKQKTRVQIPAQGCGFEKIDETLQSPAKPLYNMWAPTHALFSHLKEEKDGRGNITCFFAKQARTSVGLAR